MQVHVDKMLVNSALDRLVAQQDPDGSAAQIVIDYASQLQSSAQLSFERNSTRTKDNGSITGYAAGHGNLSIKDRETEERNISIGVHKDRIGHYKVWKVGEGIILFHHFWKSDLTTKGEDDSVKEYILCYNTNDRSPKSFGVREMVFWFEVNLFNSNYKVFRPQVTSIYGSRPPKVSGIQIKQTIFV